MTRRRKLLLADDSPTVRKVISLTFADEGVEVVAAGDGREALRLLEDEPPPDVILADVHMPGPDGYELCERVRRDPRLRHIPVMLLVGTFEPFNEAEARRVGAETVLTKPFQSIRDLVSKVGSLLGGESKPEGEERGHASPPARGHRELAEEVQTRPPAAAANTASDMAEARADAARRAAAFGQEAESRRPPERGAAEGDTGERPAGGRETREEFAHADPHTSFADLGEDDELIEARPAEAFGGAHTPSEFAAAPAEFADPLGDLRHDEPPPPASANPSTDTPHSAMNEDVSRESFNFSDRFAVAEEGAPRAFATQSAGFAAADDALLDLGQIEPPAAAAAAEADDFVLDLDDDFAAPPPAPPAQAGPFTLDDLDESPADAPGAFAEAAHGETVFAEEEVSQLFAEPEPAAPAAQFRPPLEESAPAFADAPASFAEMPASDDEGGAARTPFEFSGLPAESEARDPELAREVVGGDVPPFVGAGEAIAPQVLPAAEPTPATVASRFTDGSVEGDVPRPDPFIPDAPAAPPTPGREQPSTAGYAVGEARAGVDEQAAPPQLSPETIDAIARRVVELMSDKVVREVAWEVVPDLAELIIRRRLDEERSK